MIKIIVIQDLSQMNTRLIPVLQQKGQAVKRNRILSFLKLISIKLLKSQTLSASSQSDSYLCLR